MDIGNSVHTHDRILISAFENKYSLIFISEVAD